jgi:hypothetical protein
VHLGLGCNVERNTYAGVDGIGSTVARCYSAGPLQILQSVLAGLDLGDWKCSPTTHTLKEECVLRLLGLSVLPAFPRVRLQSG